MITWDVYKQLNPGASDRTLVWVGQVSTVVLVILGLLWIPMMELISGQIYQYLQSVQAYISPPIAAVFLLGIFWPRLNSHGAVASLATGFVLGIGRLVAELSKDSLSGFLYWYADINFLHFAIFLFVICASVLIVVSFATPAPRPEKLRGLTFATTAAGETAQAADHHVQEHLPSLRSDPAWKPVDKVLTVGAIFCVAAIWLYFTG